MTAPPVFGGWPNLVRAGLAGVTIASSSNATLSPDDYLRSDDRGRAWRTTAEGTAWVTFVLAESSDVGTISLGDIYAGYGAEISIDLNVGATPPASLGSGDALVVSAMDVWPPITQSQAEGWRKEMHWARMVGDVLTPVTCRSGRITITNGATGLGAVGASMLSVSEGWQAGREYDTDGWSFSPESFGLPLNRNDGAGGGTDLGRRKAWELDWSTLPEDTADWLLSAMMALGEYRPITCIPEPGADREWKHAGFYSIRAPASTSWEGASRGGVRLLETRGLNLLEW